MNGRLKPYLLILPAVSIMLVVIATSIITALVQSLGYYPMVGLNHVTLKYYTEVLTDREFLHSLCFSLYTAFLSSSAAVILGVLSAYCIAENKRRKDIELFIFKLPIVIPHIVVAFLIFNIVYQGGILARVLYILGIISKQEQFPLLIFDKYGIGIILTYLWKEVPFVAIVVYTVLGNINEGVAQAARNLGANRLKVFRYITFPLILPSIISSFIIVFVFSFGAFEVPYLLGPTSPKALPVKAYIEYINPELDNRPYAMVINIMLIVISVPLIWLYEKLLTITYKACKIK